MLKLEILSWITKHTHERAQIENVNVTLGKSVTSIIFFIINHK